MKHITSGGEDECAVSKETTIDSSDLLKKTGKEVHYEKSKEQYNKGRNGSRGRSY